jgi:hypothetical protein
MEALLVRAGAIAQLDLVGDLLQVADRLADLARRGRRAARPSLRDSPSRAITATRKATSTLASARSRSGTYSSRSDGYTSANGSSTGADIRCSNAWNVMREGLPGAD